MRQPLLLTSLLLLTCVTSFAQPGFIQDSLLSKMYNDYPQEKVFLQTDRQVYVAGETIWMKAWCTLDGIPSYLSKVLYIDIVNSNGTVVDKKMYKLDSLGSTPADFDLAPELASGNYRINAYTLWMLNFPEFVFSKELFIYGGDHKPAKHSPADITMNLEFFPEGGNLVEGVKTRVAFKLTSSNGLPASGKGYVVDRNGNRVADIMAEHNGMGVFELDAEKGNTYTARIEIVPGREVTWKLPAAQPEGISLRVENSNPQKLFILVDRNSAAKESFSRIRIVGQSNHQVVFRASLDLEADQNAFSINKKDLPPGIVQVTAFNDKDQPLAERLAFIENYQVVEPKLRLDTVNLSPRQINRISFTLPGIQTASVSVAVTDASLEGTVEDNHSILAGQLLTSDLRGVVHQPGYYFKDKSAVTLRHLDLLMMTQGWRRFEWRKLMNNEFAALKFPVESAIWLGGKVTKSDRKEPVKEGVVSFVIKGEDSTSIMAEAGLTDKGEFLLKDVYFQKKAVVSYMGTNAKKQQLIVDVHLEPGYVDTLKNTFRFPRLDLDTTQPKQSALAQYISDKLRDSSFFGRGYLGNVTVTRKKMSRIDSLNNEYASGTFLMGTAIDPSNYKNYVTPWQMLQASTPGISVEGNPFDPNVFFRRFQGLDALTSNINSVTLGESSSGESVGLVLEENGIAYFLNEVNVSKDVINSLSIPDIALIKVLKNEGAALGATQGVIAFYTHKGAVVGTSPYEKGYTAVERQGFAIVKHFYTPALHELPAGSDKRITLYWSGSILPLSNGEYFFRFNNNDASKAYRVVVQGIDKAGQLIYHEQVVR